MKHVLAIAALMLLFQGCIRRMQDVHVSASASPTLVGARGTSTETSAPGSEGEAARRVAPRYRIDWGFIQAVEGRSRTQGYVPTARGSGRVLGKSGVTVGTGFDLGQHDLDDLERMGIAARLARILEPYLTLKGSQARGVLRARPLVLTHEDARALDRAKRLDTARKIERRFDAARAEHMPNFARLSPAQQTVIFSLATQYGPRLDRKTPAFWAHVVQGRFGAAHRELRDFGDQFPTRRNREADMLLREHEDVVGSTSR